MVPLAKLKFPKSWLFVIIPFVLFLIYLVVFAKEKFRAEATYVIHDLSSGKKVGLDLGIFGASQSSHKMDASIVKQYLLSMDLLKKVDARFHLRDYYRSGRTEVLERLLWYSSDEDFLKLFRKNLAIDSEDTAGITFISFESTDPDLALNVLEFLLQEGEAFLNNLNHKRVQKKISFISSQFQTNKSNLDQAIKALEDFQDRHRMVDPSHDVAISHNIIANLETEIVNKTAAYNQLISYMSPDTIDALRLNKEIEELRTALKKIKNRLSGSDKKEPLNELMFEYQELKNNVDFATEIYKSTLVQSELNKIEALEDSKVFEVIASPQRPDGHIYPMRMEMTVTAAVLLLIVYYSCMMLWTIIQDHKD